MSNLENQADNNIRSIQKLIIRSLSSNTSEICKFYVDLNSFKISNPNYEDLLTEISNKKQILSASDYYDYVRRLLDRLDNI